MKAELVFYKLKLGQIEDCYAVLGTEINDTPYYVFGGEGTGSMRAYSGDSFQNCSIIWEGGGGTMSIVRIPDHEDVLLASRGFYSMVESKDSSIEIIRYKDGSFTHEPIARLEYLHRFDTLLAPDGVRYILAASLHGGKKDMGDWSRPGHLYCGTMPDNLYESFNVQLTRLPGDFHMNHGFCKGTWSGREAAFTASREGVFVILPPESRESDWIIEQLIDQPASDIAVADVDSDGNMEIAVILPFHGDQLKVFRWELGQYREVYSHPVDNDFYHAVISGKIDGELLFAVGARKNTAELFLLRWNAEDRQFFPQRLDVGPGPSNLSILNRPNGDCLLAANRMISEAAVYFFE